MNGCKSWITRACFASDSNEITLQDPAENSLLLGNEQVFSIVEVAKDRLVIHVADKDILLIQNW